MAFHIVKSLIRFIYNLNRMTENLKGHGEAIFLELSDLYEEFLVNRKPKKMYD